MSCILSSILQVLGCAAVTALPLFAQGELPATLGAVRPIASARGLATHGTGLHGFGRGYSSTFDSTGLTFTPALPNAPRAQRLGVRLQSITRGGVELPTALEVAPEQVETAAIFRRSATITERYEVRIDGVEQSFVFDALPGRGDLIVRCSLSGELATADATRGVDGIEFMVPDLGGVTIGAVTGIDATGRRCAGELRVVDGSLEMGLPASFVDTAALPLVLDPLYGARVDITVGGDSDVDPAVACSGVSGDFLIVWVRKLSLTSSEVFARHYHEVNGLGTAFRIDTGVTLRRPKVAYHRFQDRFLIVWERADSWLGIAQLKSRIVNSDRTLGPALDLTAATADCTHAALSGNPGSAQGDSGGLVVYREAGLGIRALPYTMALSVTGLTLGTVVSVATDPLNELPRISRTGNGVRVVSFSRPGWITAQPVDESGSPIGAGYSFSVGTGNVLRSDVDGAGSNFLLVHEAIGASSREIAARMFTWSNPSLTESSAGPITSDAIDDREPAVALLGPKYLVAWTHDFAFLNSNIKARPISITGCVFCGTEVTLTGSLVSERTPVIGNRLAGGSSAPDALIVSASFEPSVEFRGDITATHYTAAPGANRSSLLWPGCGANATLTAVGSFAIGNGAFRFRVATGTAGGTALFAIGFGGAQLPCGTCTLVQPVVLSGVPIAGGEAAYRLPVPCDSALLGALVDVQGLVLGAVNNQCPLLPTLSTTPAWRFQIVE
ncbi:MAG: hypothetical protein AB7I19_20435 [Planctomycetota bacterium]